MIILIKIIITTTIMIFIIFTIHPPMGASPVRFGKKRANPNTAATFDATCRSWNQQRLKFFAPSDWFCSLRRKCPTTSYHSESQTVSDRLFSNLFRSNADCFLDRFNFFHPFIRSRLVRFK